jgi:hypothetical protein
MGQPKAAELITRQPSGPRSDRLDVATNDAPMFPDDDERKVACVAEVHDVLTRGAKQLGSLTRRKELLAFGLVKGLGEARPHDRKKIRHKHKKHNELEASMLFFSYI